jgi:hypothetical protein
MAILAEWYARSERAIEDHLKTHSLLEWVQEVQRLRRVADAAEVWADFQTAAAMDAQELERREREAEEALRDAVAESRPGDRR